jgi:transaldolase
MNKLEQLKAMTTVVADTGDLDAIRQYAPEDATTNPSLLLKVAGQPGYRSYIDDAMAWAREQGGSDREQMRHCIDRLSVNIGREILNHIPGRVSTEVSARYSFDTEATLSQARKLISLYNSLGVDNDRVLIKVASTWEGIRAAETLEREGIHCNLTLLFSFAQAAACADAGVYLVSPFVGRIYDWYRARTGEEYAPENDPGVGSVTRIYHYFKNHGYDTVVMGASFRTRGQIEALAGCDRLTISPQLLEELAADTGNLRQALKAGNAEPEPRKHLDEKDFRWALNEDAMATEKLAEGIRKFHEDEVKLEQLLGDLS